jgi:hypothetical protein
MLLALTAALILEGAVTYAFVVASAGVLVFLPLAILSGWAPRVRRHSQKMTKKVPSEEGTPGGQGRIRTSEG